MSRSIQNLFTYVIFNETKVTNVKNIFFTDGCKWRIEINMKYWELSLLRKLDSEISQSLSNNWISFKTLKMTQIIYSLIVCDYIGAGRIRPFHWLFHTIVLQLKYIISKTPHPEDMQVLQQLLTCSWITSERSAFRVKIKFLKYGKQNLIYHLMSHIPQR